MGVWAFRASVHSELPLRSWFFPYDRRTIIAPLDKAIVQERLTIYLERLNSVPQVGLLTTINNMHKVNYRGALIGDTLSIDGPYGYQRWRLDTRGVLHANPNGTSLKLTLRFPKLYLLKVLAPVAFLLLIALSVGFPIVLVVVAGGFMAFVIMFGFRSEASRLVQQLLQVVGPQPEPGEGNLIVPDGTGWRCLACHGYVRKDATFCKHCKEPFYRL